MFAPLHGRRRDGSAAFAVGGVFMLLALAGCGGGSKDSISITQQGSSAAQSGAAQVTTSSQTAGSGSSGADSLDKGPTICTAHDTVTTAGHDLAARQALYFNDVGQSADFFLRTLEDDASNVALLRQAFLTQYYYCLLYTSPSPRDRQKSRMPSSA